MENQGRDGEMYLWTAIQCVTPYGRMLLLKLHAGFSQQLSKYLLVNQCLRMLGFSDGYTFSFLGNISDVGPGMTDVECTGTETDIRQCEHFPYSSGSCGVENRAGVICLHTTPTTMPTMTTMTTPTTGRII